MKQTNSLAEKVDKLTADTSEKAKHPDIGTNQTKT